MNIRLLNCSEGSKQKHVSAIGQEGSFSDIKTKIEKCFECSENLFCQGFNAYLVELSKQNSNINAIKNLETSGFYKGKI